MNIFLVLFRDFHLFLFNIINLSEGISFLEHVRLGAGLRNLAIVRVSFPQSAWVLGGYSYSSTKLISVSLIFKSIGSGGSGLDTMVVLIDLLNDGDLIFLRGDNYFQLIDFLGEFLIKSDFLSVESLILRALLVHLYHLSTGEVLVTSFQSAFL